MKKSLIACIAAISIVGCGGGDAPDGGPGSPAGGEGAQKGSDKAAAPSSAGAKDWDPALGTATVKGVIRFKGEAPRRRPVDMGAEARCKEMHPEPQLDESVIVNPNGTLKNVFVYVSKGLGGWKFPPAGNQASLEQKGCVYVPHVQGVRAGQQIKIRNGDPFLHNVHSLPNRNTSFNFSQPQQGMESTQTLRRPEVMVKFKCDVHGWMSSYVGVVDHPYFAVTSDDGAFELSSLPPGEYTIEAWHEVYGTKTAAVKVGEKETQTVELTFEEQ